MKGDLETPSPSSFEQRSEDDALHAPEQDALRRLRRIVLDRSTTKALIRRHPGLREKRHRDLLLHSLFGDMLYGNKDRGGNKYVRPKIPAEYLARLENREEEHEQKHYVGRRFLEDHQAVLPAFDWTGWEPGEYPRQVSHHGLSKELIELIEEDLRRPLEELRAPIYASTLDACPDPSTGRAAQQLKAKREFYRRAAGDSRRRRGSCTPQRDLLSYLNSRSPALHARRVNQNAKEAIEAASQIEKDSRRLRVMMQLRLIQIQPKPFYQPSSRGRTVRLFPLNESYLGLPKDVRGALLAGCLECDLSNAQLAIVAKEWGCSRLYDHLRDCGTIWPHLFAAAGYDYDALVGTRRFDEVKDALKGAIYSLVFGMSEDGLWYSLLCSLGAEAASSFFADPIVTELLAKRSEAMMAIDEAGGVEDCFGNTYWISGEADRGDEVRSILSCLMQAQELRLFEEVIAEAIRVDRLQRSDFQILAWLHDGFVASVSKNKVAVERRLVRKVEAVADDLDIPTVLETEWI